MLITIHNRVHNVRVQSEKTGRGGGKTRPLQARACRRKLINGLGVRLLSAEFLAFLSIYLASR